MGSINMMLMYIVAAPGFSFERCGLSQVVWFWGQTEDFHVAFEDGLTIFIEFLKCAAV